MLLRWASCYEKTDSIFQYRDGQGVPRLVAWLVEFNERPAAIALCERWRSILQAETDIDECGEFIGRGWAEHALAIAALGDKDAASYALHQAHHWIDKARSLKLDPNKRLSYFEFAQAYAAIAARQAVVLGADEPKLLYDQAYEFARLSVTPEYGEYVFERIINEQLTAGDSQGARETIKRMQTPRFIGKSWKRICEHNLNQGLKESARTAARQAVESLDRDGFEPFMAQDIAPVAATVALAGEKALAQSLFQRALALSERNDSPKFNHPWIADSQVRAELLADAYRTIQSVGEPSERIQPLAQLCKALAKAESVTNKVVPQQNP